MLNLSRTCHHALKALMYLVKNKGRPFIKIEEIASKNKIPANFLSKIFQILAKNDFVVSQLGPKGGVRLSNDFKHLSVYDIIIAIDGRMDLEECVLFGDKKCPEIKNCPIQDECRDLRTRIWTKLKRMKLVKLSTKQGLH